MFVLPSKRKGFGITTLEAMTCKTPVVTLKHPMNAVVELIDEMDFGVYAEKQKLADTVLSLLGQN